MEIAFRVRNVDLPDRVRAATRDKVTRLARRWRVDRAEVCFSGERNPRITERERCAITLWGPQRILRAEASAADAGVAANRVLGVLERRAYKLIGGLRDREETRWTAVRPNRPRAGAECVAAVRLVSFRFLPVHFLPNWSPLGLSTTPDQDRQESPGPSGGLAGSGDSNADAEAMTPEDAALEMLAWDRDCWQFVNAETGRPAVLQRCRDGAIAVADLGLDPGAAAGCAPSVRSLG